MEASTIKLFLVKGNPNSIRTAEISNWTGKAVSAPRTELHEFIKRSELDKPGIYFLTGTDSDTGEPALYIGEAESVSKRVKGHSSKDFWSNITAIVSKDENLTKAHIRYLEGKLIKLAEKTSNSILMNSANSGARLPESDEAEMNVFLDKVFQLLPVLGINDFKNYSEKPAAKQDLLYCSIKGLQARGRRTSTGFLVLKGSQAVLEHRASATNFKTKREYLIKKGILEKNEDHLVFTKDYEFGSPSTAGSVVRGGNTNGLVYWKDKQGRTLKEIEESKT